jgi:lipid-binding SYLF domain-containing protein
MHERIHSATEILNDKQNSDEPIPADLLAHAKGVAIFTLTKAGIGIGGQGGEGIVLLHFGDVNALAWTAPSAINFGGGSIGAQLGFTDTRYIIVLNTDDAVEHFTGSGKMTWNATATGTAGSTTGTEKVTTAELERRDIVVYKDTDGVFGGATLGSTTVERKNSINEEAYGDNVRARNILNGSVPHPASASRLYVLLDGKV